MLLAELHLPPFVDLHLQWFVAALIVVIGLLVTGIGDLGRLSLTRIWAISGVCFQESIRRRVLWIVPLAILGIIIAAQLLNPLDEQDAIRQTIKYSLFATGMLVVMVTIILACTNLPKEIDNRVIYTIVTKPTTRLEIILGKIVGFARVSATLLLIMGVFTMAYAGFRAGRLRDRVRERLETLSPTDPARPSLQHYADNGLLESKSFARPVEFQQFARAPEPGDELRWITGNQDQGFVVGFDLPPEMFPQQAADSIAVPDNGGLTIQAHIVHAGEDEVKARNPIPFVHGIPDPAPFRNYHLNIDPAVNFEILGPEGTSMVPATELARGGSVILAMGNKRTEYQNCVTIGATSLDRWYQLRPEGRRLYVRVTGFGALRYGVSRDCLRLVSPKLAALHLNPIIPSLKGPDGQPAWPVFRGREIMGGQQMRAGATLAKAGTGIFHFTQALLPDGAASAPIEMRVGIEGSGDDTSSASESITQAEVKIRNLKTGKQMTLDRLIPIESNRTAFFNVPAAACEGGDFDIQFRCLGAGHYIIVRGATGGSAMQVVTGHEPFVFNLFKSLLIMWLLSVLVIIISIFCSTFVSWPIAVVLTAVILISHWGAQHIAESNAPGLGAAVVKDMFSGVTDPARTKALASAIDALSRAFNTLSKVLPDIGQFAANEDIERGVTISWRVLAESGKVILAFGVPMTVLAYAFLKRKEVAP